MFYVEIHEMRQHYHRYTQGIIDENQKLHLELEDKMQEHDSRSKQHDEQDAQSDFQRGIIQQEKEKVCDVFVSSIKNLVYVARTVHEQLSV